MGITASTSLARLRENKVLLQFVGQTPIAQADDFWKSLLTFSFPQPKTSAEAKVLEESTKPLAEALVRHNPRTGNLRTLVRIYLELAANLRDESKCESNLCTWQVHNALLIIRLSLKFMLETLSEDEAIIQLDGSTTVHQITSLETPPQSTQPFTEQASSAANRSLNFSSYSVDNGHAPHDHAPSNNTKEHISQRPSGKNNSFEEDTKTSGKGQEKGGYGPEVKGRSSEVGDSPEVVDMAQLVSSLAENVASRVAEGKGATFPSTQGLSAGHGSIDTAQLALSGGVLLSRQLVEGLVSLLAEVPLLPFTYDVHLEAVNLFLVLLSSQMFPSSSGAFLSHMLSMPSDLACLLVHSLLLHFAGQPPLPPDTVRSQSTNIVSSITFGLWSLVMPARGGGPGGSAHSPLGDRALLLLLVLAHQASRRENPYRHALFSFSDERGDKAASSFCTSLEKLYLTLCQQLCKEPTTLFLYLLLQGNRCVASFIFSRSDIDQLVLPLLQQLYSCGDASSHHVYMLLTVLLILSQDDCFNKSIHEITLSRVPWYTERTLPHISLGSLVVIVLVRTIQVNVTHIRDKYLHTNCLAALANMSTHFHSLNLEAAQKIVNLFKLLAKRQHKIKDKIKLSSPPPSPLLLLPPSPSPDVDYAMDQSIVEEILQMVLEITNSCLTHNLHNNPHLVYSLLYQREIFEPYRTHHSLMDLVQNIETVVAFFSARLEKTGPSPYSSAFVLDTITQASKSWPRSCLRVFPELKFRYVEEDQPEEFFIPYVWTLVFRFASLYWDNSRVQLGPASSSS